MKADMKARQKAEMGRIPAVNPGGKPLAVVLE
jgi:hypothetical protein